MSGSKSKDSADNEKDVRTTILSSRPYSPTEDGVYEHEVTHPPYRNSFKHCMFGKGVSLPQNYQGDGENIGITISMDYYL